MNSITNSLILLLAAVSASLVSCTGQGESRSGASTTVQTATPDKPSTPPAVAETPTEAPANPDEDRRGPGVYTLASVDNGTAAPGQPAPNFSWKGSDGRTRSLADYKGRVVLINFWGTWCPPCRRELPDIVSLREEYKSKGFEVIGICLERSDDPVSVVTEFASANGLMYPLLIGNEYIASAYGGIQAVPTTFVVDKSGIVRESLVGMQSASAFKGAVDRAM